MRLVAYIIRRDNGICWLCHHPGADTADHVLPIATHPHLAWDPANLRAAHGRKRTRTTDGYECQGNYGRGATPTPPGTRPSRKW